MVEWLQFVLRAWHQSGDSEVAAKLLDHVNIAPGDPAVVDNGPGVPRIRLKSVSIKTSRTWTQQRMQGRKRKPSVPEFVKV